MPIAVTIPTGKNNMLASLREYLQANLPLLVGNPNVAYTVELEQYENAESYPSISFEDLGIPSMGGHAFDDFIGEGLDDNGAPTTYYGKIAQTIVELNCQADAGASDKALQQCYQMRDQLEQLFMFTGRNDHSGTQILPAISLKNFDVGGNPITGSVIWAPMEKDSIWMESFVGTDPSRAGIKRLSIRVRIYWHLLEN